MMTVYRVFGSCSNWECHCECTLKTFKDKEEAIKFSKSLTCEVIADECGFCSLDKTIDSWIEELEVY